jgi:hypothetical protein
MFPSPSPRIACRQTPILPNQQVQVDIGDGRKRSSYAHIPRQNVSMMTTNGMHGLT